MTTEREQPNDASEDETRILVGASEGPQSIGRYLIEGVLGEGAMGVVYKGFDPVHPAPRRDQDDP